MRFLYRTLPVIVLIMLIAVARYFFVSAHAEETSVIDVTKMFVQSDDDLRAMDSDGDGLSDYDETRVYKTNALVADSDGDGYLDGEEIANGYSPTDPKKVKLYDEDSDHDGLNDLWEIALNADRLNPDTDGDGYKDGEEVQKGYSPTDAKPVPLQKKIVVNRKDFRLTYYLGDTPLESTLVSTGRKGWETPTGTFTVEAKVPIKNYYNYPNTPYNLKFTKIKQWGVYIHTAYWHNKFGIQNVSSGCVNVPPYAMKRLYDWADVGTAVSVQ